MRIFNAKASVIVTIGICFVSGCASNSWQADNVPLPRTTPFDSDQFARSAYLEGFRTGYRAQASSQKGSIDVISGPHLFAKQQGFYAGAGQALATGQGTATGNEQRN